MVTLTDRITKEDLFLYATNTSAFYPAFCNMANHRFSEGAWSEYVSRMVVRRYKEEFPESIGAAFPVYITALDLREYYIQHMKECA